ncbi:MAG: hypothetical protein DRN30_05195 [Thermoplasmata archaeon]|nr:hypothetical protein [Euryarchaeota archaeon]RLF64679.1 MAG: hypothetical protein DRN30_05195 [Thermoplasmata archaeon]
MTYAVFKGRSQKDEEIFSKDDIVSRQSIRTYDLASLGLEGEGVVILVEGSEDAVRRAKELAKDKLEIIEDEEAEKIYEKIKELEDSVSMGVGAIFG